MVMVSTLSSVRPKTWNYIESISTLETKRHVTITLFVTLKQLSERGESYDAL